jgi:hypothetical protein
MQHLTQDEIVLFHYREMSGRQRRAADEHLQTCSLCRGELAGLARTIEMVETLHVPERGQNYGSEVWMRIRPRLTDGNHPRWRFLFPLRAWALAASAMVLLAVAFWGGRWWQERHTPAVAAIPPAARERILMVAVGDHLERTQMLLVELLHQEPAGTTDVSPTKELAQDLLQSNRLYRQTALRAGDPGLANLLDQLERVLLDISHSPNEISAVQLAALQHEIESQGILFKVRVVELELQGGHEAAAPPRTEDAL